MINATEENLDELQSDIGDVEEEAQKLIEALSCAGSCETPKDFNANIDEARELLKSIKGALDG